MEWMEIGAKFVNVIFSGKLQFLIFFLGFTDTF